MAIGSVNFYLFNATVMNGTVDITSGGTLKLDKTGVGATNVDFKVNCALRVEVPFKVRKGLLLRPRVGLMIIVK